MFSPIDPNEFIEGITVLENLAFGKLAMAGGKAIDDLHELLGALLEEEGLRAKVAGLIGDIHLTAGGTNISPTTHERIAFIRAAMRRPDILVLDQALQTHHHSERLDLRERTRALLPNATIIHLEPKVERQDDFDEVFEIADGLLVSDTMPESDDADGQNDLARKIRAFGRTSLFDGLSRSQLRLLAFASQWFETKAGDYIFREGEDADAAYLITDGMGELGWADSGEIDFEERFVKPGRLIGDLSVIQGDRRSIDLIAREDVRGLRIGATEFLEVIGSDPEIALSLLRTVSGYLIGTAEQLRKLKRKA